MLCDCSFTISPLEFVIILPLHYLLEKSHPYAMFPFLYSFSLVYEYPLNVNLITPLVDGEKEEAVLGCSIHLI